MKALRPLLIALGLLLFWQMIVFFGNFPSYILPSPAEVLFTTWSMKAILWHEAQPTIFETLAGLFLGISFGSLAALIMSFIKPLRPWLLPMLLISQAIPTFTIAPILVIWFGYGSLSKVIITFVMVFFPITTALYDGLQRTPLGFLDLAQVMEASPWQTLWHIRIPAALPSLASGIRVASALAPVGAIVGEWVGASQGLGYLMLNANARLEIPLMFASLLIIVLLTLFLYFIVDQCLKLIIWRSEVSLSRA